MRKRALALLMTATMMTGILAGCGNGESAQNTTAASTTGETTENTDEANAEASTQTAEAPKYVFLFIGDGRSVGMRKCGYETRRNGRVFRCNETVIFSFSYETPERRDNSSEKEANFD